jgi:hypothetical protein
LINDFLSEETTNLYHGWDGEPKHPAELGAEFIRSSLILWRELVFHLVKAFNLFEVSVISI